MRKSIASVCVLLTLAACQSDKPEDQVRKAFETCRAAVENGDAAAATAPLDASFRGPEGMDRATARGFLLGLLRQEKVGATVLRNDVSVRGHEVFQEVDLLLTSRGGSLLPNDASHRSFHLRWRKSSGAWRLVELQSIDGR